MMLGLQTKALGFKHFALSKIKNHATHPSGYIRS